MPMNILINYYKVGQVVLHSRAGITKTCNYYKEGQYNLLADRQFVPENY